MQHSADPVNARYLLRSVRPRSALGATMAHAPCVTWDVIIGLHQAGQCCSQFGCIRYQHDAAGTTQKRSDECRCHDRPFAGLTYSAGLEHCSLPGSLVELTYRS